MTIEFVNRQVMEEKEIKSFFGERYIIGFSGYTKPPANSNYMERARRCVERIIRESEEICQGAVGLIYGSSDGGIDKIVESLWRDQFSSLPLLGITCQEFIEWVPDEKDRPPIVIRDSVPSYARLYVEQLDLLVITGGRKHVLEYDLSALSMGKQVYVEDCAPEIDTVFKENTVQNAAALLKTMLYFGSPQKSKEELEKIFKKL